MNPYSRIEIQQLLEADEISPEEEGFMLGYLDAAEE